MKTRKRIVSFLAVGCLLSGCQMMTSIAHTPLSVAPSSSEQIPITQIIGLWEPSEGVGVDNLPTRGFAGQLLFFTAEESEPVQINGDVQIFVFDDLGSIEEQAKPLHTFNFDQESFQAFRTETNLGYAYQLFLPYTRKENFNTTCSIRVKVTPENGRPVYSKMAGVVLTGPDAPQFALKTESRRPIVQLANHETITSDEPASQEEIANYFRTSSLPNSKSNRNADRKRLKSTLSKVVQDSETSAVLDESDHLLAAPQHQIGQEAPTSSHSNRHPLLTDD